MGNFLAGRRVKNALNSATRQRAKPSRMKGLNATDVQVLPNMVEVEYYENAVDVPEYDPQKGFNPRVAAQGGKPIELNQFFIAKNGMVVRIVAVIGGAGYGKTEMLKKFANDVIDKNVSGLEDIEVTLFIYFRDLPVDDKITPGELLLSNTGLRRSQIPKCVKWISSNADKVLLVIDGADQYKQIDELGQHSAVRSHKISAPPAEIINAILSGNLFPGIRVLYSSREHAIRHFESEVRPDRTIGLVGFEQLDIQKLVEGYGGERGCEIWNHLSTKSHPLLSVCSIPMFLVFTVLAFLHSKTPPECLTEVLMLVLYSMVTSTHIRSKKSIYEIIPKLRKMAFKGTSEKRVTFTLKDLPTGLTVEDIQDLLIPYPGRNGHNQKLVDGLYRFIFIHQSLQEALSSLHVNQMPLPRLEQFLEELHQPQWAIVRRFTCGIIANNKIQEIVEYIELPDDANDKENRDALSKHKSVDTTKVQPVNIIQGNYYHTEKIITTQYLKPGATSNNVYNNSNLAVSSSHVGSGSPLVPRARNTSSSDETPKSAARKSNMLKQSLKRELERVVGHHDLLELLHSLHECGENIDTAIPPTMKEIILGDVIPSPADTYVISSVLEKCKRQIHHVVINTFNASQLKALASCIRKFSLSKVKILREDITQRQYDLLRLFRAFRACGDNITPLIRSSLKTIDLGGLEGALTDDDDEPLAFVLKRCSDLDEVQLPFWPYSILGRIAKEISMTSLKIRRVRIDVDEFMSLAAAVVAAAVVAAAPADAEGHLLTAICDMMPHVTERLILSGFRFGNATEDLSQMQEKLDSLPETELKIVISDEFQLSWRQPYRTIE